MTIQLSVTIWTVICFCLLMLILRNLLFKPVLELIDRRKQRMEQAVQKKAEYEAIEQEHRAIVKQKTAEFAKEQAERSAKELEDARRDHKLALEQAQEQRFNQVEQYRKTAEEMHKEIVGTLERHTARLAADFARTLIKDESYGNSIRNY